MLLSWRSVIACGVSRSGEDLRLWEPLSCCHPFGVPQLPAEWLLLRQGHWVLSKESAHQVQIPNYYIFFQVYLKGINSWYQGSYHQSVRNRLNMKNKQLEESVPKQKLVKEATTVGVSSVTVCQQRYVTHQLCSLGAFELFPLLTKGFCCSRQPLSPWWGSQLEAVQQQQHQVHPEVRISACSPGLSRPWFGFPAHSYCFSCCPEDADTRCWFFFF